MKKLLSLILVVVLVLGFASFASAGTITWGGNLRFWYMNVQNEDADTDMSTFQFDRVAITFKDVLAENYGISAELQWRNYAGNDTAYAYDATAKKTNSSGTKQARLDSGYFYYDNLLGKGDELQIGALSKLPFRLGLSKNCNFVDTGLGSKLKIGNCVGISYELPAPNYTIGVGVANANGKDITNQLDSTEGFSYSLRLDAGKNFFGIVPGLRLGAGYNKIQTGVDENFKTNTVVDVAYVNSLFWASAESASQTVTKAGDDADPTSALYIEAGVFIGKNRVWVGRLTSTSDDALGDVAYKDTLTGTNVISGVNEGTIVAAIVPILASSNLQFQYIVADDDAGKEIDIRYQVTF